MATSRVAKRCSAWLAHRRSGLTASRDADEAHPVAFDLTNLKLFVRVATLKAFGRAGEELGLSPTNASHRIRALESELDVKLFNRTTRAVSLTPDGEIFLEHAQRILDDVEAARSVLSDRSRSVSGRLRVTASASFGRSHIVPFLPEFLRLHPDVELELNLTDAIVDIVEQGYDIAFRLGELAPSSLLAQKIDDDERVLVAAPTYLERAGVPEAPDDLLGHACLSLRTLKPWRLRAADGQEQSLRVAGPVSSTLGDAIVEWALAGVGVAQMSLWHAGPHLRTGRLVRVLPDHRIVPETKIWAVRPPGRLMRARVKALLDFMRDRIVQTNRARCYGEAEPS